MDALSEKIRDPVCGMNVDPGKTHFVSKSQGKQYYFCAEACLMAFEKDPDRYIQCEMTKRKGFWGRYMDRLNKSTEGKAMKCH